jgi:hypothetical protein
LLVCLFPLAAARADSAAEKAASEARQVFRRHCVECHGTVNPRAGLSVLDRNSLVEQKKLVVPGRPSDSELLQLVEAGTMPPGTKPKVSDADRMALRRWVEAGAAPFPREFGEDYVLRTILEDVREQSKDRKALASTRYFSLNHFLPDAEQDLGPARAAFVRALQDLSPKDEPVRPVAVDPNETVFRVDLRQLGWEETPYDDSRVNLFDLILLEYPFATLPERSEVWDELSEKYLQQARPVRPVAYLRADWFVQAALRPSLRNDLLKRRIKPPPAGLDKLRVREPQGLSRERLLFPLDGITYPRHNADHPTVRVTLEALNAGTMKAQTVFPDGGKLVVRLTNGGSKAVHFQLVFSSSNGEKEVVPGAKALAPGQDYRFPSPTDDPPSLKLSPGRDSVTVFASEGELPEGRRLTGGKGVTDRVLHDFYPVPPAGRPFDAGGLVKQTVEVETRAGKEK